MIEQCIKLTEKKLSNGKYPGFYLATVTARKIKRTTD